MVIISLLLLWIKQQDSMHHGKEGFESWHEFARPQIHGYDMICYDNISPTKFVSGGDEKYCVYLR